MGLCMGALILFWQLPDVSLPVSALLLCTAGFFIYGPQALIGIASANLATKRAAASAAGLTGIFGYFSTVISGYGVGWLVQHRGWDSGFLMFVVSALLGTMMFALCWPAKADGYDNGK
jgi:OPA family glycerol-3-phosphate transporter-like MFS transporter/OPA family sugar phosphate sensor protein UhpC-like MFS transporter